ncbi:hypothetical protein [Haliangium ochraceum]|uniref:Uncharacterized protein n=1 Tax=Haliangium ochraceum (strain DSM 14365 / JCM 11303 / SMP-2) TaxID=502025 RepID=D0LGD6_HALO1|nr:hypothetical protein [Haliangium ochraceum]ACY18161.1 conserved hypothetical protein [Haliangium ochraceum DSM 14365]
MSLALPPVVPLEIWDRAVFGQPLQAWRFRESFPHALAALVRELRALPLASWPLAGGFRSQPEPGRAPAGAWPFDERAGVEHVYLMGGGASEALRAALAPVLPCTLSPEPMFAAAREGARQAGACADLGQTAIKLALRASAAAERLAADASIDIVRTSDYLSWRSARDFTRAPVRDDVHADDYARARASTAAFLGAAVAPLMPAAGETGSLVLALPSELGAAGEPYGCSYCWDSPDRALLADIAAAAGGAAAAFVPVNDAVLAAAAAARDPALPRAGAVLVLTIGFGVGGALLAAPTDAASASAAAASSP